MSVVIRVVHPAKELTVGPVEAGASDRRPASAGFDALFREHYPRVVAMLVRLTGDRAQAEEIASDAFHKLSARDPERAEATPWLYRVATNGGLDAIRLNSRRRVREREAHAEDLRSAATDGALESMLREERRSRVQTILGDLKPRDAQLLLLRAEGLAYRELAEALGVQPSSVGTFLARAEADFERRFRARYGESI